ncbi:MAG: helix-turn-helix domain-containing protein [Burkholderiaceae bacterium]|nr:helix-turn-helix domain-containing protein [Burkholderiaceae bacterium]
MKSIHGSLLARLRLLRDASRVLSPHRARSLAAQYGLDHGTVRCWVERYRQYGEAGLRKKFSHYSARFKLSVLRRMWRDCRAARFLPR